MSGGGLRPRRERLGGRVGGWGNLLFLALAGLLAVAGFAMLLTHGQGPKTTAPARAAEGPVLPAFAQAHDVEAAPLHVSLPIAAPLGYSVPVHIDFDEAAIHADVLAVGLDAPLPAGPVAQIDEDRKAAWYALGPAPGELGSSAVAVRVAGSGESASARRGAAAKLSGVKAGQTIRVTRADHSIAVFTVDAVVQARSGAVPSLPENEPMAYAGLRLVAYTGSYLQQRRGHAEDTVVFAHLSASRSTAPTGRAN